MTLIANYIPLQDAYGGPNYFTMDPNALYEIHIDNNGDAREDITFQFRFKNNLARHRAAHRRQEHLDSADPVGRHQSGAQSRHLNVTRDLHARRGARRSPRRHARRGHQCGRRRRASSPSRSTTSATRPSASIAAYDAYAAQYIYNDQHPRLRRRRPGVRRPAQGSVRRQPWPNVRSGQPQSARPRSGGTERPGRQERHHARAGSPRSPA